MESLNTNITKPHITYRGDYKPPEYKIKETKLYVDIYPNNTNVNSVLDIEKTETCGNSDLVLNAVNMEIKNIHLDGKKLDNDMFTYKDEAIVISADLLKKNSFRIETEVVIHPETNYELTGLYKSNDMYVTQCESTGFRHITPFIDRPDVMSKYEVTICADKNDFPVLLCNGDKIDEKEIENGRHCAIFRDPHPKPSYLFGLVAGKLAHINSTYTTTISKKKVELYVYSEQKYVDQLYWALETIKKSMYFDESYFGLEYDLTRLNLVAVSDFNMGAMENKGLNIFNVSSLLASKKTSLDFSYERILTVVAHEYFHNWTGNRVTLRDWFQLTLKEGLTVFREHLFSQQAIKSDTYLLDNVNYLRTVQFAEDASPMAHPIRPDSYITVDNFYTSTVYEKGCQVMRMYWTILGEDYYKKALKFYIEKNDGKGATCEDYHEAMEKAYKLKKNDVNATLDPYLRWFSQSGTPIVHASYKYDSLKHTFTITLKQHTNPTKDQKEKLALFIPVRVGLINPNDGTEIIKQVVLEFKEDEKDFVFEHIPVKPLPSIFRQFSAPVIIYEDLTTEERISLLKYDRDSFVKSNNSTSMFLEYIIEYYNNLLKKDNSEVDIMLKPINESMIDAIKYLIESEHTDPGVKSYLIRLPTDKYIMSFIKNVDTDILYNSKLTFLKNISNKLKDVYFKIFLDLRKAAEDTTHFTDETHVDFDQMNQRKLRNGLLYILSVIKYPNIKDYIIKHSESPYFTNKLFSLLCAAYYDDIFDTIYENTYTFVKDDNLMLTNWITYVVSVDRPDIFDIVENIKVILKDTKNPNLLSSLYSGFSANTKYFNQVDGRGYKLVADAIIEIDSYNSHLAAILCGTFKIWTNLNETRQNLIKTEIKRILDKPNLSKNVQEYLMRLIGLI